MNLAGCRSRVLTGVAIFFGLIVATVVFHVYLEECAKARATTGRPARDIAARIAPRAKAKLADGIAVAMAIDVSGSMANPVAGGSTESKIAVARRVASKAVQQIGDFADTVSNMTVVASVSTFSTRVSVIQPFSRPTRRSAERGIRPLFAKGDTAIGDALIAAKIALNETRLARQYVLLITDGLNTAGVTPDTVLDAYRLLDAAHQPSVYVIAFDVDAASFKPLSERGATVVEARNAGQLQEAIDRILYGSILVEQP